jgi:hypothetical protein
MKKAFAMSVCLPVFWFVGFASPASAQTVEQLTPHKVKLESVDYLGKRAIKIIEDGQADDGEAYAIVKSNVFHNGTIELELAGSPAAGAMGGARGFIGMAFGFMTDSSSISICVRQTAEPMIRSDAIILRSTVLTQILGTRTPASRHRENMKAMWTLSQASGPAIVLRSKGRRPVCLSTAPASHA